MATKYKPILFSTEMVKAILEGRKAQTRRMIKPQPIFYGRNDDRIAVEFRNNIFEFYDVKRNDPFSILGSSKPKFQIGNILWVRETWKVGAWNDEDQKIAFDYLASPELKKTPWVEYQDYNRFEEIFIKIIEELDKLRIEPLITDEENERFYYKWEPGESPFKWKPSIFMPKEAARIFLEVTNVRLERLQNITVVDAEAEGIVINESKLKLVKTINPIAQINAAKILAFASLWKSINGEDFWKANPWVWVYEFKVVEKPKYFLNE